MRIRVSLLVLAIALVAAVFMAAVGPAEAAPQEQASLTIIALGFVDMVGGNDPACPGCNGEFDPGDQELAEQDPMPAFTVIVRDSSGTEIARETTQPLAGLQRVSISVPEDTQFEIEVTDPEGWELCPNEARTRTLTDSDFALGNALEEYHFWQGCDAMPTATSKPAEPTAKPGEPTKVPEPTAVSEEPDEEEEDEGGEAVAEEPAAPAPSTGALGSIRGLAFIDENEDGMLGPEEPGVIGVGVSLQGGGQQMYQTTNGAGQFSFDGLAEGQYDVSVDPGSDWRVTTTSGYTGVEVIGGEAVMGIDFGLVHVTGVAPSEDLVIPPPGGGIRLPDTGIADISPNRVVTVMALLLAGLALIGFSSEHLNRRG